MSIAALIIAALFVAYTLVRAEFEKYELRKKIANIEAENHALVLALQRRPQILPTQSDDSPANTLTTQAIQRGRPGRFQSFGRAKRILENQPAPQRSVNV
jgi:hypothetical protein